MNAKGIGLFVGLFVGIILCLIIFRICNKNSKLRSEYDERQEVVRGRAFKYGFYTAIIYMAFIAVVEMAEIKLIFGSAILNFAGVIISICVMAVYSIWNDAYWGINNNRTRYMIIFVAATVINLFSAIEAIAEGNMIADGVVQAPGMNLLCGVLFLIIAATLFLKRMKEKHDEEES